MLSPWQNNAHDDHEYPHIRQYTAEQLLYDTRLLQNMEGVKCKGGGTTEEKSDRRSWQFLHFRKCQPKTVILSSCGWTTGASETALKIQIDDLAIARFWTIFHLENCRKAARRCYMGCAKWSTAYPRFKEISFRRRFGSWIGTYNGALMVVWRTREAFILL